MKVRIGLSTGATADPEALAQVAADVGILGFDSLWMPEILTLPGHDPLVGLAWAAATNPDLKIGTTMLLPGRNLLRLAKAVATLDALSGGRFLLTFVPGIARGSERHAVGIAPERRGEIIDDALPVLRRLWAGETVTHHGPAGDFDEVAVRPVPHQDPFEVWLGGMAPAALRRCGALGDGWLPALCTPDEAAEGKVVVERSARGAGRGISPEHFGVSVVYAEGPLDPAVPRGLLARTRGRPVDEVVPSGLDALRTHLLRFIDVGFSKFVVRPLDAPADVRPALERLAEAVGDLQT